LNIYLGFGIIFGFMILMCIAAVVVYNVVILRNSHESSASIPEGTDQSDYARMLQDKYKAERDSGDFKRKEFD
jgi:hypothetical protein